MAGRTHVMGVIYLLHFEIPYKHAKHYMGWSEDLSERLSRHEQGEGARLLQVLREAGIKWVLVRTWEGDRFLERRLKKTKNGPRLCPICLGR